MMKETLSTKVAKGEENIGPRKKRNRPNGSAPFDLREKRGKFWNFVVLLPLRVMFFMILSLPYHYSHFSCPFASFEFQSFSPPRWFRYGHHSSLPYSTSLSCSFAFFRGFRVYLHSPNS